LALGRIDLLRHGAVVSRRNTSSNAASNERVLLKERASEAARRLTVVASSSNAESAFKEVVDDLVGFSGFLLQLRLSRDDSGFVHFGFVSLFFLLGPNLLVHEGGLQSSLGRVADVCPQSVSVHGSDQLLGDTIEAFRMDFVLFLVSQSVAETQERRFVRIVNDAVIDGALDALEVALKFGQAFSFRRESIVHSLRVP